VAASHGGRSLLIFDKIDNIQSLEQFVSDSSLSGLNAAKEKALEKIRKSVSAAYDLRIDFITKEIKVLVRPGRGARRINWWLEDTSAAIPKAYRRKYLLLHTAAHFLQPSDAPKHGYGFLKTYFALIQRELGKNTVEALKTSLKANGVAYRKPRAGTNTPEHSQMLRERMQAFNALRHKRSN
jgi:putative metallohydrolase (TIGR04338 family)